MTTETRIEDDGTLGAPWAERPLVGTIWATSWGYDQTNVEFLQVIRETAATVWVREIAADVRDGRLYPIPGQFLTAEPNSYRWPDRRPDGNRCRKHRDALRIDDVRYAFPYRGGGAYDTAAAGGAGH